MNKEQETAMLDQPDPPALDAVRRIREGEWEIIPADRTGGTQ